MSESAMKKYGFTAMAVKLETKGRLDSVKVHYRESYSDCINRLIDEYEKHLGSE